jgi:hypothetical protein
VKELEAVLKEAEDRGWRVEKRRKYWMMWCPCGECLKTVKCTPSLMTYERNLRAKLARDTCWEKQS